MTNRISRFQDENPPRDERREPQPIGKPGCLAQYQVRFPQVHIAVVETPASAV